MQTKRADGEGRALLGGNERVDATRGALLCAN